MKDTMHETHDAALARAEIEDARLSRAWSKRR